MSAGQAEGAAWTLDPRLDADCHALGRLGQNRLLLMDNAQVPWFILVPQTSATEFYQLEPELQQAVLSDVNALSAFIKDHFAVHKLNIAAIGNLVRQLHIHVIGRYVHDPYWPGVVWGAGPGPAYRADQIAPLRQTLSRQFGARYQPAVAD